MKPQNSSLQMAYKLVDEILSRGGQISKITGVGLSKVDADFLYHEYQGNHAVHADVGSSAGKSMVCFVIATGVK